MAYWIYSFGILLFVLSYLNFKPTTSSLREISFLSNVQSLLLRSSKSLTLNLTQANESENEYSSNYPKGNEKSD
jgi:hypothetical protein